MGNLAGSYICQRRDVQVGMTKESTGAFDNVLDNETSLVR